MKRAPILFELWELQSILKSNQVEIDGRWVPARPMGFESLEHRLKLAWMVFTGKADALIWPMGQ